ncbi:MAG TPA: MmcQ/YjbR family DNA-binding protein [Acidimicrobiales bacterium]|nr:MmcQ/YjbR family DNA-binding protein [Acidimicrobiales bacterium]
MTTGMGNMDRLEQIVDRLPEATRVDIEAWDGEPTFRVNGKNFIFTNPEASMISVKLPKEEATAVVATDARVEPTGYGLGRHGWISVTIPRDSGNKQWREIEEWVRTSYTLVAPKRLARLVLDEDSIKG